MRLCSQHLQYYFTGGFTSNSLLHWNEARNGFYFMHYSLHPRRYNILIYLTSSVCVYHTLLMFPPVHLVYLDEDLAASFLGDLSILKNILEFKSKKS